CSFLAKSPSLISFSALGSSKDLSKEKLGELTAALNQNKNIKEVDLPFSYLEARIENLFEGMKEKNLSLTNYTSGVMLSPMKQKTFYKQIVRRY
ncbi:hypothetical protein AB751O23_CD_00010, partial [Chlamydiales bacterium SCGC AB-751-O23]